MDIFEPLPPEIMRWIDGETARYEFLLRDTPGVATSSLCRRATCDGK
jgi:hypothetical protein